MSRNQTYPIMQALLAALLFGASAPLAKLLLGEVQPIPLAAFLYLGAGLGLLGIKIFQRINQHSTDREAKIGKSDFLWLAGAMLAGGVAAPIILLFSLQITPAATASLLLNFEAVATTLIAALVFKEAVSPRVWWAILLITLASIFLSVNPNVGWGFSWGTLGIIAACLLWGIDNNFTRNISAKDPLMIVTIKGLGAGIFSFGLSLILGSTFPALPVILEAMVLGTFSYGVSIVLFIRALRDLGAARTSGLFSTAPLAGVIISLLLFREFPGWWFIIALPFMSVGTFLLLSERHTHQHVHETIVHEHSHVHHDGHHEHDHKGKSAKRHSHAHRHEELAHAHHHMPDLHHRHPHSLES